MRSFAVLLSIGLVASAGFAQEGPGPRVDREAMWPAPTAEDWKRPCLITWQRTWEDAVQVSKETGRPILVCINMDGEIASEHYAGIRYRDPAITALYEPYVTVVASVYRHSPRDHDEEGRRILCPRFGSVTCGEHIAIEPGIFEKYCEGTRVAPRHIGVDQDGAEYFDVYYTWDTDSVFQAVRTGLAGRPEGPLAALRGDRTLVERVQSRDVRDRRAVEKAFSEGDRDLQRSLLEAALGAGADAPVDLLRLGLYGLDEDLAALARRALAGSASEQAIDLIADVLRAPLGSEERAALVAALARIGETSPRARTVATAHQGLSQRSQAIDVARWTAKLEDPAVAAAAAAYEVSARLETQDAVFGSKDAEAHVALAEAFLARAIDPEASQGLSRQFTNALLLDARQTALEAEKLGAKGWRLSSVLAVAAYYLDDREEALARAEAAVGGMPEDPQGWNAMITLGLFVEARQKAITEAVQAKKPWPGQWLTDVSAAYEVLARHPDGTDTQVAAHYDFLRWLGAVGPALRVLDQGLARFPASGVLHNRLRCRILAENGIAGLESVYAAMLAKEDAPPALRWFAGYAALLAGEYWRNARQDAPADEGYARAIAHFEASIEAIPEGKGNAVLGIAMAIAGQARLALERKELAAAADLLVRAIEREPRALQGMDGISLMPIEVVRMLRARLGDAQLAEPLARLEAALAKVDPELRQLPAYERGGPGGGAGRRGRPRPNGGG